MAHFGRPSLGGRGLTKASLHLPVSKEVYSFPILPPAEIIEVLREMGVVVSEDDINKPKADQFRQVCELFVMEILGISKEEMYSPQADFVASLGETADLHEESVPVVHFMRNINKVLSAARCDEGFTLHDLMKPDRSRVLRILSALINLQKFKAEKLLWYEELEAKKQELAEKKRALLARQEELKQRIAQEKAIRAAEQPAIDQVTMQCKQLKEELERMRAKDEVARAAAASERSAVLGLRDAKRDLVAQLEAIRAETDLRKGQIVGSPARLKAEVSALEAAVAHEQHAVDDLDGSKRVLLRQTEVVAKADKDVRKALALMAEAEVEGKKLKNIMKDEKARKAEAEALTADVETLRGQVEHASSARKRAEDKLGEVREAYGQRAAAQARAIDMTRREASELGEEIKAAVDQRRVAEATRVSLEREQEAATAKHTAAVAEMIATMKHFSAAVGGYNGALLGSLGQVEGVPFSRNEGGL